MASGEWYVVDSHRLGPEDSSWWKACLFTGHISAQVQADLDIFGTTEEHWQLMKKTSTLGTSHGLVKFNNLDVVLGLFYARGAIELSDHKKRFAACIGPPCFLLKIHLCESRTGSSACLCGSHATKAKPPATDKLIITTRMSAGGHLNQRVLS